MIKTTYHHRFLENRISNAFLTEKCFSLVEVLNFKVILLFQSTIKEKIVQIKEHFQHLQMIYSLFNLIVYEIKCCSSGAKVK